MAGRIILDLPNPSLNATGGLDTTATLTFYQNGTVTPQAVYTDPTLATALMNPLSCDGAARFPEVWAPSGELYSVKWTLAAGTITFDNISPLVGAGTIIFASNYTTLAAADTAAGSSGTVVLDSGAAFSLSANTTLGAAKYIAWGGTITRSTHTATFTHAGPPSGATQVFDAAGTGLVTFAGRAAVIYAETFGAVGDNATPSANAMQQAHNALKALPEGGTLITPDGSTLIETQVTFDCTA